ncbi:MAG: hypothetical protein M1480_09045 [Bacteroidetes bacterium]|nr:hypothetical protein [Bacteroidota bacterium]
MKISLELFFILLFVYGCSDPVKIDLKNYSNQIKQISAQEEDALKRWNSVSGDNFVNDGYMYQALDTYIIDNYSQFLEKLNGIKPQTKEIQELNNIYIQAAQKQLNGFKMMRDGLEKHNKDIMNKSYQLLTEGRTEEKNWVKKYEELSKSH